MTDQELIDWIKSVSSNDTMPADTNERMTRLIQILINNMIDNLALSKPAGKRNTLKLNKVSNEGLTG